MSLPVLRRNARNLVSRSLHAYKLLRIERITAVKPLSFENQRKMSGTSAKKVGLDLSGIYPPIPTPFQENEDVDYEKLKVNLDKWNKIPFAGKMINCYC